MVKIRKLVKVEEELTVGQKCNKLHSLLVMDILSSLEKMGVVHGICPCS